MKDLNSKYTAERDDSQRRLVLSQRSTSPGEDTPILFQQFCLGLTNDRSRVVLRRYFECYSPTCAHWVEYAHSIATADLIHWIMSHGQLHIECSQNTPLTYTPA
ncbi:hypothetical protein [Pseudomonas sp. NPDC089569]|uniref:hypothetical protein n=1 Tax=Pseudomonas sp. NPDC089569 TaxID=3390722 RepID=UPI003CFBF332